MAPVVVKKAARTVPNVSELTLDDGKLQPPPKRIALCFEDCCDIWAAVDIEMHELVPNTTDTVWVTCQFGHFCRVDNNAISNLRIVQLGWCIGRHSSPVDPSPKSTFVKAWRVHHLGGNNRQAWYHDGGSGGDRDAVDRRTARDA